MYKKTVSGIMLTLLLFGIFSLAINVKPAKSTWTGTVYIRADGSIDPPDAPIITYDNVTYVLTDNITSSADGIVVERDNIVIDGAGHTLEGTGEYPYKGVDLSGRSNVTIKNVTITNFYYGIYLSSSNYNDIVGNNITANNGYGILLWSSSNNSICGNNIANNRGGIGLYCSSNYNSICGNNITANNGYGICLRYSSNNTVFGNNITANSYDGIRLYYSSNNSICGNNITANNAYGICLVYSSNNSICGNTFIKDGLYVWGSYHNSVENNTVNGKRLVYLEGVVNHRVQDAGQVILINCTDIEVKDLNLSSIDIGVDLWETTNSIISGNNVANNTYGIRLGSSSNNSICGNNIIANNAYGIQFYDSSNNIIIGNNLTANGYGIYFSFSSSSNGISGNNITNNGGGIYLSDSSNNTISTNEIANNGEGIRIAYSAGNLIFHNNFIDNIQQAYIEELDYPNVWDDSYPSGGNYWSDYTGVDSNGDGIGDAPYAIDVNNVDRYPLMGPFNSFDTSVGYSVDVISNSTVEDFRYFESNSTIVMHVSNMTANQVFGFCRLTIPHEVMSPPYTVKVNGTEVEYKTIYENYTEEISIIYFTYEHSKLEIVVIQEFPFNTMLSTFLMLLAISLIFTKKPPYRKTNKTPHF